MFYLVAAISGASALTVILKVFRSKGVDNVVGITVNYFVGAVLALLTAPVEITPARMVDAPWFGLALVIGVLYMVSFVIFAFSAQYSGVAVTAISQRAAMAIPVLVAFLMLGEQPTVLKVSMTAVLIASMPLILSGGKSASGAQNTSGPVFRWAVLLPVTVFLFNGLNDSIIQYTHKTRIADGMENNLFMGTIFLAGAVTGVAYYFIACRRKPYRPTWNDVMWGAILGFTNWVCLMGMFHALLHMQGSVFYPLYYTGTIVVSTLVGVWAFRERLSKLNYAGILIAVAAIIILAVQ